MLIRGANFADGHRILPSRPPKPDDPGARRAHAQPADRSHHGGDLYVVIENVPTTKNARPIVIASADERQDLLPSISHVAGDVQPILKKPDDRNGKSDGFVFA